MNNRLFLIVSFVCLFVVFSYFITYKNYLDSNYDSRQMHVDNFRKYEISDGFIVNTDGIKRFKLRIDILKEISMLSEKTLELKVSDNDSYLYTFDDVALRGKFIDDLKEWNKYSKTKIEFK